MDDYLSESEQLERIREIVREYGLYAVAGIVLGLILIFGWRWYGGHERQNEEQAAALYTQVRVDVDKDQVSSAAALIKQLRDQYPSSPYTDQAGLMLARSYLASETTQAAMELRYVMEHSDDHELALVARLRLARVLMYEKQNQDALNLLAVDKPGQFAAQISELRGDAYAALGDSGAARTAYSDALTAPGADWLDRNYLQMKLIALPPADQAAGRKAASASAPSQASEGQAAPADQAAVGKAADKPALEKASEDKAAKGSGE
ncbi:MAG TPA: tetratricopeptide repeat protein [Gammaproteobacteria bacterium]|nr:tetratricopeptide repeat protein [Gammaproteobacteria bacterium]